MEIRPSHGRSITIGDSLKAAFPTLGGPVKPFTVGDSLKAAFPTVGGPVKPIAIGEALRHALPAVGGPVKPFTVGDSLKAAFPTLGEPVKPFTIGDTLKAAFPAVGKPIAIDDAPTDIRAIPVIAEQLAAAAQASEVAERVGGWARRLPDRDTRAVVAKTSAVILGLLTAAAAYEEAGLHVAIYPLLWAVFYVIDLANSLVDRAQR